MSNNKSKNNLFWPLIIGAFVFTPCFLVLLDHREESTSRAVENNNIESQLDDDDDMPVWVASQTISTVGPNTEEVAVEEPEEDSVESQKEYERLANWKANFPYQPTTDPNVVIAEEMLENMADPPMRTHVFLRGFFENEARFTAQFEQLYHILEEHGRGDNPVAAGNIFNCLWNYHESLQKDPDEISDTYSYTIGRYCTNAEVAESFKMNRNDIVFKPVN